jgi:N-acyl-D-aspartate/D-glutamate deacylase
MTIYEMVIANGRILDGCGNPWYWGDVGIQQGRITEIAPAGSLRGERVLDAAGRYVSPGFIDIHTHSDLTILVNRRAESAVRQGATTHVIGNCGMAPAPVGEGHVDEIQRYWGPISNQPEVSWGWRNYNEYLQVLERVRTWDQHRSPGGAWGITHGGYGS